MSILSELIFSLATSFDDEKYPSDVYHYLLETIKQANTPAALGEPLSHALAWKDGKVRRNPDGPYQTNTGIRYTVGITKPNTFNDYHQKIINTDAFYMWAREVIALNHFYVDKINDLQNQRFQLWDTIVIPVFVLHCLNPRVYPIVDRWVIAAFNVLQPYRAFNANPVKITATAYEHYHNWWLRLMVESGLDPMTAPLKTIKLVDAGVWALGKRLRLQANELEESAQNKLELRAIITDSKSDTDVVQISISTSLIYGTDSKEFKSRAVTLWKNGDTQVNAIRKAALEFGIQLKPSYTAYPGSHFDRWKKQGF